MATTQTLTAADIMSRRLITVSPEQDLFEVIDLLVRNKISGAPVVDRDGKYLGIFSERSSISLLVDAAQRGTPTNRIAPFVDCEALTVSRDTDLWTIAQILMTTYARRLPVVEDGRVIGMISRRDVLKAANRMLTPETVYETSVLYVSAVRERSEAPVA